jgi:hypothetical protein
MFRPVASPKDPPDELFRHHLRLSVLFMMRGSGLASQMGEWWDSDSDESYNSSNLRQDGNNQQFFEAAMTEKLVNWMLPHDGTETGYPEILH